MRFLAGLIVGMMVLATFAGTVSAAEEEDTCAVLFDFGNGRVMWADVPVTEDMNAFNVTAEAADMLDIDLQYSESTFGVMVGPIEGMDYNPATGQFWGFIIWNSTTAR